MKRSLLFIMLSVYLLSANMVYTQPIIADFQVNDNEGGAVSQSNPKVIPVGNNFLIVFEDNRGIIAQLFNNDRTALSDNFLLDGAGWSNIIYESFASAVSDSGNIIVVWRAGSSYTNIMAHLFESDGTPIGESFKVSNYIGTSTERSPAVASGDSGKFIITWDDGRADGRGDIYAKIFDKDGNALGEEWRVNDDSEITKGQQTPFIAANDAGEFIIVWEDRRIDFNWEDIFGQRYDNQGNEIGSNFKVNDEGNNITIAQMDPIVAINDSGYFVITWRDSRESDTDIWNQDIYAQRYDPEGAKLSSNFRVNDNPDTLQQARPALSINNNGDFLIAWIDSRNDEDDTYAQYYQNGGIPSGGNIMINDDAGDNAQYHPFIASNRNGDFFLAWGDGRSIDYSNYIHLQKIAGNGSLLGDNFRTSNQLLVATLQDYPRIAVDNDGDFMVTWKDQRYSSSDVYASKYTSNGTSVVSNFRVNDYVGEAATNDPPDIAVNDNGVYMFTWMNQHDGDDDIYAKLYNSAGNAIGSNFRVNDDTSDARQYRYCVTSSNNNFFIVWYDQRNVSHDIYARRYDQTGTALGSSFKVNDSEHDGFAPAVAANDSGSVLIAFTEYTDANKWVINGQLYSAEGIAIDSNFTIFDNPESVSFTFTISSIDSGQFIITWLEGSNNFLDAQRVSGDGTLIGNKIQIGRGGLYTPTADGTGNFMITWPDRRFEVYPPMRYDLFAQRYDGASVSIGSDFKVSSRDSDSYEFRYDVALHNNRIYTVWMDRDRSGLGTGSDIWANVLDWDNPVGIRSDQATVIPGKFALNQNYPNPFNPETVISWQLAVGSKVTLIIYDILGRQVKILVNQYQPAGQHKVIFDASNLATGIYIYRLQAGSFEHSRKMILIR